MEIQTEHLILRQPKDASDAAKCHKNFWSSSATSKYMLWKPTTNVDEAIVKMNKWIEYGKNGNMLWFIYEKSSNEPIGFCSVEKITDVKYGNVGLAFGEKYVKRGYGYETMIALINYVKQRGAKEIEYGFLEENIPSRKLAEKLGFTYLKETIRLRRYDNHELKEIIYSKKI